MSLRVIQWASGAMGKTCLRAVIDHPGLELAGLYVYSDSKAGRDAGERQPFGDRLGGRDLLAAQLGVRVESSAKGDEPLDVLGQPVVDVAVARGDV